MGRRKIEIRAIKDDRNRSVTFLKRKGGLFKKAHELSVLCSVDVAVIIFGHNKKLYEFSSGDINETIRRYNYYGPPHEHKGPQDFKNKGGDDDDEDEEEDDAPVHREDSLPPQHPMMPSHIQHHNSFQHIRAPGTSSSPPLPPGMFQPRNGTPQPPQMGSRPSSRNTVRRPSSNLVPMQHPHATPPAPQNGFAYAPNPPLYTQANAAPPHPSPQPQQFPQFQQQAHTPQPQHQQLPQHQQPYIQEPPHQPPPPPPAPRNDTLHPPPHPVQRLSPQPQQQEMRPDQMTPPRIERLPQSSKSRSIFTPIDEGGSILAQHFFGAPDPPRRDQKRESPPELRVPPRTATAPPPQSRPTPPPPRPQGSASPFRQPSRSDTGGSKSGARPKLNLTIPSEASDNEGSASPQARSALNSANPAREHHGIVLPPPSPSASAVLSAGASGPPNPFARPPPPTSNQNNNSYAENRANLETPISALPSRYMDRDLLASPGGIFGSWDNFNSNILPSPNVATPAEPRIPGVAWGRNENIDMEKRKADEMIGNEGKRLKT